MTDYVRPASLGEVYQARSEHPDWLLLSGGTDAMVGALHHEEPPGVIDVFGLPELRGVTASDDAIRIGAGTPYAELIANDLILSELPSLHTCCTEVGAIQIQERGTLGGNMGTSSPVGDTLPVLLALDATVELGSVRGVRRVPYHGYCTGYRSTLLAADEVITAVEIPRVAGLRQFWRKVGTRRAQAISKVMVAAAARLDGAGAIAHVRLAMGAVANRPVRLEGVEAILMGQTPSAELAERVRAAAKEEIVPISDLRSTADYRLRVAANLAARFVLELGAAS